MNQPNSIYDAKQQFVNKAMPHDAEAERCINGGIILDPSLAATVVGILPPDDFFSPIQRRIFEAISSLYARGEKIDPITIGDELKKNISLDSIGGVRTIADTTYGLPYFDDLDPYVKIIRNKAALRRLVKLCGDVSARAVSEEYSADEVLDHAESNIFKLRDTTTQAQVEYAMVFEIAATAHAERMEAKEKGVVIGLMTGFRDMDEKTSGLRRQELEIDAGRPSMGKSALLLDEINGVSRLQPKSVCVIFSAEMAKKLCADRMVCQSAKVDLSRYLNGHLTSAEWMRIKEAVDEMQEKKIFIIDETGLTPLRMRYHLNRIADREGSIDVVGMDYAELFETDQVFTELRHKLGNIALNAKLMSKDFNCHVKLVSGVSRKCEARTPPKPFMSDLAESGKLEYHADVVKFVYREEYYKPSEENAGVAEILYAKNRNGSTGVVKLSWLAAFTRFENYYNY